MQLWLAESTFDFLNCKLNFDKFKNSTLVIIYAKEKLTSMLHGILKFTSEVNFDQDNDL